MSAPRLVDALATARVVHDRATLEAAIVRMALVCRRQMSNATRPAATGPRMMTAVVDWFTA